MDRHSVERTNRHGTFRRTLVLAAIALGCSHPDHAPPERGPLISMLRDLPLPRPVAGRLSLPGISAPCDDPGDGDPARLECGSMTRARLPLDVERVARRATTRLERGMDADALHAATLIDLLSGDTTRAVLDRSIGNLEALTRLEPGSADVFADLAAAYLTKASRYHALVLLPRALESATHALELDPSHLAARFNRALALDLIGLDTEAQREWRRYLERDPSSGWAAEARRAAAASTARRTIAPSLDAPPSAFADYATRAPGAARNLAWDRLLAAWGEAFEAGDAPLALARLADASAIGASLGRRGDSSIALAVRAIDHASPDGRHRLARAHATFGRAQRATWVGDYAAADTAFRTIVTTGPTDLPLVEWATYAHGNALIYQQRFDEAEQVLRGLLSRVDRQTRAALTARAIWSFALSRSRRGDNTAGLASIRESREIFARLGDVENASGAHGFESEVLGTNGDLTTGAAGLYESLADLRAFPGSLWRHNVLFLLQSEVANAGLTRAARAFEAEAIANANLAGRPLLVVESHIARARALWRIPRSDEADTALQAARATVESLPPGRVRAQLENDLRLARATRLIMSRAERSLATVDSVIAYYRPIESPSKLMPAYIVRAQAALALGRVDDAEAALASAMDLYAERGALLARSPQRAGLLAAVRESFDALVMQHLAGGHPGRALDALEARRAAFSLHAPTRTADRVVGRVVIDYGLIGDTLLAWVRDGDTLAVARSIVPRDSLFRALEEARTALERGLPDEATRPSLSRLYERLIRPIEPQLPSAMSTISIVWDQSIGDVPWGALFDRRTGRYLVERGPLRLVETMRDGLRPALTSERRGAVFVANPTLDWRTFPALEPLRDAETEVRDAATILGSGSVLAGAGVDSASVVAALQSATLFHFAGHVLFDDGEPDRSVLAVAPRGLSAAAIGRLALPKLGLVVLSGCESMRSPSQGGGGFAGLAGAFMSAGAGGVIGSVWRVNDASTRALMHEFYGRYAHSGDAAEALHDAQIALLGSASPELRSPSAWGAFTYAGR